MTIAIAETMTEIRQRAQLDRLPTWALIGAASGLLADVAFLPSAVKALLLLLFILLGPGSAVLHHVRGLPTVAVRALVPVTGLAVVLLTVSVALLMGVWSSRLILLALAVLTAGAGLVDLRRDRPAVAS